MGVLFATSPFKERERDINVWGLVPPSMDSGISRPSDHVQKRTPLGTMYDTFDSERYILTTENRAFRDIAANAPYDVVEILMNTREVRRRRHLRPVQHRRGRQPVGAVRLRPRVRASPRGPGRRVLHVGCRVSAAGRPRRAVGAERDGAARPREAQMEGSRRAGHAAADALAEGAVRKGPEGGAETPARDPREPAVPKAR